jgi:hypothetical protein
MKTLYQVSFREHSRSAKNKASIGGILPHEWADRRTYDRAVSVLADSEWEAGRKLQAAILPSDNRPLACLSYLRQYAVRPLKVGQAVSTPPHADWLEERDGGECRTGKYDRGIIAEVLGDDPATGMVGVHMYREVYRDGQRSREWYTGPHGERIVVDFPIRQLVRVKVWE